MSSPAGEFRIVPAFFRAAITPPPKRRSNFSMRTTWRHSCERLSIDLKYCRGMQTVGPWRCLLAVRESARKHCATAVQHAKDPIDPQRSGQMLQRVSADDVAEIENLLVCHLKNLGQDVKLHRHYHIAAACVAGRKEPQQQEYEGEGIKLHHEVKAQIARAVQLTDRKS